VRVEALAKKLGVSKGGFYWHFADRPALLREMLDAWEKMAIDDVIERVDAAGGDGRAKLMRLFDLASGGTGLLKVDLAVRDWARRDTTVARRLRRADNRRFDYLRAQFGEFCSEEADIEARCLTVGSLWIGSHFMRAEHRGRERRAVLEMAVRRLLE
jgi:AcrR family transcriptional regulator